MIETVVLLDVNGTTVTVPLSWTDSGEADVFVTLASGRSWFRAVDLVRLAPQVEELLNGGEDGRGVYMVIPKRATARLESKIHK